VVNGAGDCAFCRIVNGDDATARIVYRDDETVAFFPLNPVAAGHTLVVPRRHVPEVWGLTGHDAASLSHATLAVAHAVRDALAPDGLNVIQSNGRAATQSVWHVHVHLVPRWEGDAQIVDWPTSERVGEPDLNLALEQVRAALEIAGSRVEVSPEDRRQHLAFIQAVITRMSQASATAKSLLLPVVSVTYGFALTQNRGGWIAGLGLLAVLVFGVLDANYLKQERAFRGLYDRVARGAKIPAFAMNPQIAAPAKGVRANYWPDFVDVKSWAIAPIYGPLLIVGLAILVWHIWF
jgi:histidine triad (HIT) family protein